jgi:citrate lyase subunit beta/citryl-CoA lyase
MPLRSLLFVPGSRPERFDKALASGATAVVIDLEDAVGPAQKAGAREQVLGWLDASRPVFVRINAADTAWFADDLSLCAHDGVAGIMVPKAESAEVLARVSGAGARAVLPLVESAAGFDHLKAIAAGPGVIALAFGSLDLQHDLGMRDAHEDELLAYRTHLVLASRLAGLAPPIDGVTVALDDDARLRDDVERARRLGFGGKLCIHPRQVAGVNRLFAPSAEERAWARRVVDAMASAGGEAVQVDGRMVDRPVLLRAQALLRDNGG